MNTFLFYVNGQLMAPDYFSARLANSANDGRLAILTVPTDVVPKRDDLAHFDIDVLEVRASNVVRRYRYEHGPNNDASKKQDTPPLHRVIKDDNGKELHEFRCHSVPNAF